MKVKNLNKLAFRLGVINSLIVILANKMYKFRQENIVDECDIEKFKKLEKILEQIETEAGFENVMEDFKETQE